MKRIALALFVTCTSTIGLAQFDTLALKTPEGITNRMLELISGDIGEARNWDEYRNLFLPKAQKISFNPRAPKGRKVRVLNLEEFIRYVGPLYKKDGFEEIAIGVEVDQFKEVANVFQSFHCKNLAGTYEKRGVNSYQLVFADNRWWIANVSFTNESDEEPLPEELLFPEHRKTR